MNIHFRVSSVRQEILYALCHAPDSTLRQIAEKIGRREKSLAYVVKAMTDAHMLERKWLISDGRGKFVYRIGEVWNVMTETGQADDIINMVRQRR